MLKISKDFYEEGVIPGWFDLSSSDYVNIKPNSLIFVIEKFDCSGIEFYKILYENFFLFIHGEYLFDIT